MNSGERASSSTYTKGPQDRLPTHGQIWARPGIERSFSSFDVDDSWVALPAVFIGLER